MKLSLCSHALFVVLGKKSYPDTLKSEIKPPLTGITVKESKLILDLCNREAEIRGNIFMVRITNLKQTLV